MKIIKSTYVIIGIIALLILSNVFTYFSLKDTEELLDKQTKEKDELITALRDSYIVLQDSYIELEDKNERLEKRLQEKRCKYTEDEVYLLAQCVEAEAGYDSESQRYITQVILNRVNSGRYPDTIKKVIYQKTGKDVAQFSVAYNGSMEGRKVKSKTLANVYHVLLYGTDLPDYVHFFYSVKVTNNWVNTLNTYKVVDGTVFAYADRR